jgi:hypothetical protein
MTGIHPVEVSMYLMTDFRLFRYGCAGIGYNSAEVHPMDKSKPFEIIAARFQVSKESARYFLDRVQKSFQIEKPPHQLIVEFMSAETFESLPKPYQVARMMNEAGIWSHALNQEPPGPADEADLYGP